MISDCGPECQETLREIELRADDRAKTGAYPVERQAKQRVERERAQVPETPVAPQICTASTFE